MRRPDGLDCFGQAPEPVADEHEDVTHAAVLDLGQDVQPVLGALAAVTGPQPQDVPAALRGDGQSDIDGPVGDRSVADFHMDGVDEDDGIDRVQWAVLPFGHALQDLVGDGRDGLAGDVGAIDLGQVGLDLARGQALRGERDDHLVDAGQAPLPFLHDLRLERSVPVARDGNLHRADLGQHRFGAGPVAGVAAVLARRIVPVITEVIGDLALQSRLQKPLRQLLQQTSLARQLESFGLGAAHQLLDQLVIHRLHRPRDGHL